MNYYEHDECLNRMYWMNVFSSAVYCIMHLFILINVLFQGNLYMFMGLRLPGLLDVVVSSSLSKGLGRDNDLLA